ncbi:uracil-DNA glycosylase family protein [Actibacterium sp. 188UL27-1]|uniref:uracil-DNA glycosylase n=1 Tax=Actibacterium sp. 188UL27-1 TaxID=2786961 RepID=UPI00351C14F2
MGTDLTYAQLVAALDWQIELGADEAICDAPIDRYGLEGPAPKADAWTKRDAPVPAGTHDNLAAVPAGTEPADLPDPVTEARQTAMAAPDLEALRAALSAYQHCELRKGARNLVFADGRPEARLMIIGEAPGAEEDRVGKPFVGRAGQLLDRMFAAIGMRRDAPDVQTAIYITNILPWRPPQNRDPKPEEVAMMRPFVERHVDLVDPDLLILMGNHACQALLGKRGITRLRGTWTEALGRPALPMFHPAYLLRNPVMKREAWSDLLDVHARLSG